MSEEANRIADEYSAYLTVGMHHSTKDAKEVLAKLIDDELERQLSIYMSL